MPRQPRNFKVGGVYHIFNRGIEKRKIFLKNQDYSRFILALEFLNNKENIDIWHLLFRDDNTANTSTGGGSDPPPVEVFRNRLESFRSERRKSLAELQAFALMPNHFHLILKEIQEGGISKLMQKLGGYAIYFNKQYKRDGSLFQGRYKSVEIKDEVQLGNIFNYVHTNPVELIEPGWKDLKVNNEKKALEFLNKYKWSSYNDYIGKEMYPHTVDKKFYIDHFGDEKSCKQSVEDWVKFKAENADLDNIKLE